MRRYLFALLFFLLAFAGFSQTRPFANEIAGFKHQDSVQAPAYKAILLVGSSSFTRWTDVQEYFPTHTIINRGFGGSSLPDLIYYYNDIIVPYKPKQVLIYCGENDFGNLETTPEQVTQRVKELVGMIQKTYPRTSIAYISMKPSPFRQNVLSKMKISNNQIKTWMKRKRRLTFIDVWDAMLNTDGSFRTDIYAADKLHMNATGYKIWQGIIEPYLKD